MNDLLKRLNMDNISDWFDECYEKAVSDNTLPVWLTKEYLEEGNKEFPYFSDQFDGVVSALDEVVKNKDMVLFAKTLYYMLEDKRYHEEVFAGLEFPQAPEGENPLAYDIFSFYPMFARIREAMAVLKTKGLAEDIVNKTYSSIDGCIKASTTYAGRFAFNKTYFLWCTLYKNAVLFKIDRFSFEVRDNCKLDIYAFINKKDEIKVMMKEGIKVHKDGQLLGSANAKEEEGSFTTVYTESETAYEGYLVEEKSASVERKTTKLSKSDWTLLYKPGDNLISVHIPGKKPFDKEIVESSIEKGRQFFKKLYPEKNLKGFMCISWLLAPKLKEILKPTSNIIAFQNIYTKFPYVSEGLDVFHFVFEKPATSLKEVDLDALPEKTSLERTLKNMYKNGEVIYETGGIFKF